MKTFFLTISLFIIAFLFGSGCLFTQTPSVKPVKKEFFLKDTLSFVFDGVMRNDGSSEWNPLWGVLKRSVNGWDTLINVRHRITMKATVPYSTFSSYKRDFIVIDNSPILWTDDRLYPDEYLFFNRDGEYILTVLSGNGKQLVCSEPFSISTKTIADSQLAGELRLSPDTVIIENHQLFLKDIFVWRNMMPKITNGRSKMIARGQLVSNKKELLKELTLKKHYVVKDDQIWMSDYDEKEIWKPIHKNYMEAVVRSGPLWKTGTMVDVIWEFEYLGKTYRVIAKSRFIAGIE